MPTYKSTGKVMPPNTILTPGVYSLTVEAAEEALAKSGNDTIKLVLREQETGATIRDQLVFTERAFWKIDQFLAACGVKIFDGNISLNAAQCVGLTCEAYVRTGTSDSGATFNEIKHYITEGVEQTKALRTVESSAKPTTQPKPTAAATDSEDIF